MISTEKVMACPLPPVTLSTGLLGRRDFGLGEKVGWAPGDLKDGHSLGVEA
jgi:hypothetical protein